MAKKSTTPLELGKRERQIYETVLGLKEASVSEVLSKLDSPPSCKSRFHRREVEGGGRH